MRDGMVSLLPDDDYRVSLPVFEGPIDLLVYLIRKKEIDIHEISLSEIVDEYLEYVELIKLIDIEKAGDFIVMATTLMKYKARNLFASGQTDGDIDEEGPRASLIRYLLEFEKLGGVADKLAEKEDARRNIFPRGGEKERIEDMISKRVEEPDFELFDLLTTLRDVLKSAPIKPTHQIEILNITQEMKQKELLETLEKRGKIDFIAFVKNQPRLIIVLTFVAMLELIKKRKIRVRQSGQFKRITITIRIDDGEGENN